MKKIVSIVLLLLTVLLAFASCAEEEADIYTTLNGLLKAESAKVTVGIETETSEGKLTSSYVVENTDAQTKVTYEVQEFAKLSIDSVLPENRIETAKGYVIVKDGKIVDQNGAAVNAPLTDIANPGITLKEDNLTELKNEAGKLSGKVTTPKDFLKTDASVTELTFEISYTAEKVTSIVLNYKNADGNAVKTTYTFA